MDDKPAGFGDRFNAWLRERGEVPVSDRLVRILNGSAYKVREDTRRETLRYIQMFATALSETYRKSAEQEEADIETQLRWTGL